MGFFIRFSRPLLSLGGASFVDNLYVIYVLFLLCFRARLFLDALWSPAGKGLVCDGYM